MTYFITFACYGHHLHGGESGSVDRNHNMPGTPLLEADYARVAEAREQMDQAPYEMDSIRRGVVLGAIRDMCVHQSWLLLAVHVRSNHVYTVIEAESRPNEL